MLPVDPAGRVLLLLGWDPAHRNTPFWFTIGGATNPGEPLVAAAVRELHEEVGIAVAPNELGEPIAESIGWPPKTPWQWEVGLASLATGVLGVIASGFGDEFTLATIIAFSVFYLGAAVGHVREMVIHRNFKAGNAGPIFFFDVLVPIYLIVLYVIVV